MQLSKADRLHNFKQTFEALEAAHSVVIVGGGAVGVELAAEIAEKFSGKQVSCLQQNKTLHLFGCNIVMISVPSHFVSGMRFFCVFNSSIRVADCPGDRRI